MTDEQPKPKIWLDDEVQDILRRFAATRETLGIILDVITKNFQSEAAYALIAKADSKDVDQCELCKGTGSTDDIRCANCLGIGKLIRKAS